MFEVRALARTRRRHQAFYIRRKRGLTSWTSLRPCAAGGMPTEELCDCCLAPGVGSSARMTPARSATTGHRQGLRGRILGDPAELQRVTQLICSGDDGIDVVLWDAKELATRYKLHY